MLPCIEHASGRKEPLFVGMVDTDEELDFVSLLIELVLQVMESLIGPLLKCYELAVNGVASEEVVFENTVSPLAELYASLSIYPITD